MLSRYKIINSLNSELKSLWSDHDLLCKEHECLKSRGKLPPKISLLSKEYILFAILQTNRQNQTSLCHLKNTLSWSRTKRWSAILLNLFRKRTVATFFQPRLHSWPHAPIDIYIPRLVSNPQILQRVQSTSVNYDGLSCHITEGDKPRPSNKTKQHKDVFPGVTYKKAARYFLSGINKESTYDGIKNYVENKGVHITHLTRFKPKGRYSIRTAKINIASKCSQIVDAQEFWPDGVHCRKWYNDREWDSLCDRRADNKY